MVVNFHRVALRLCVKQGETSACVANRLFTFDGPRTRFEGGCASGVNEAGESAELKLSRY